MLSHPRTVWLLAVLALGPASSALAPGVPSGDSGVPDRATDRFTEELNEIWRLPPAEAKAAAARLSNGDCLRSAGPAGCLLGAVALERAGEARAATAAYTQLIGQAGTPYATSAEFRLRLRESVAAGEAAQRTFLKKRAEAVEARGWFLANGTWRADTTRRAALAGLLELQSDRLSFRGMQYLRRWSPWPAPYAYVFTLLAAAVLAKTAALPLLVRAARIDAQYRRLAPEVAAIQRTFADDPAQAMQEMSAFNARHGISVAPGCALAVLDFIFVIGTAFVLRDFTPQLVLDGARLASVADVTRFSAPVAWLWVLVSGLAFGMESTHTASTGPQALGALVVILFSGGLWVAVGWYWQWPAYLFILWGLLLLLGVVLRVALRWTVAPLMRS